MLLTSAQPHLTQHIDDGFELGQITGAAFIDLTAAYDTINHRRLLAKLVMLTDDVPLTKFIRTMLSNRRFKVELNGKQSRWRNQRNGLPQGSVLSPLLFNVYTNDQPLPEATNSFIYADDMCLTTQQKTFEQVETKSLASGLNELGAYYKENHLRPNPAKTQLTAFHLKNRHADRKLNVTWNGTKLDHTRRSVHSQNERTKQLTDQRHSLHHHQPVKSRLHSRNSFVSTSQHLLCKPAEDRIAKWQERREQTDSNLKRYNIDQKERLPSGHTLPWRAWRTSNRLRSVQAATRQRNIFYVGLPLSRFECVSGLSVHWPIIALGTRECGVAKLCRDPTVQSEFFLRVSLLKTFN